MTDSKITVLLADDQTLIRDGLKAILKAGSDINIIGEASNGKQAIEVASKRNPDVVLMDIRMPEMDGVEATRIIKQNQPEIKVIILTTFDDDDYIIKAMSYGASGYLLKDMESEGLITAIKSSMKGNVILPGKVAEKLTARLNKSMNSSKSIESEDFTEREMEIIHLMVKGKSNAEISSQLYLSTGTVKNYISQIYMKIDVKDRSNAIIYFKNHMNL